MNIHRCMAAAALWSIGACIPAAAQSTVSIFGVLDLDLSHYSQNGVHKTIESSSGNLPSSLGFRGTEDLGDGWLAAFWLEALLTADNGNSGGFSWASRSTVSLGGNGGELRLGRDRTPSFMNHSVFDPFHGFGPAAGNNITLPQASTRTVGSNALTFNRSSNSIQYLWGFAPNSIQLVGTGFYGDLMIGLPENTSGTPAAGQYAGGRIGYSQAEFNTAFSYASSKGPVTSGPNTGIFTTFTEINLGGSLAFGWGSLMGHVGSNNSALPASRYSHWGVGASINAGLGYVPVSFNTVRQNDATEDGASQFAVGYVYNLSKRTVLYTSLARIINRNGGTYTFDGANGGGNPALAGGLSSAGNGTGYDLGIRMIF